jgi:Fe-S-cluster containining protein
VVTSLAEIRRLAEAKERENLDFRRYLTAHRRPEREFHRIAAEVAAQIDCKQCGACCRETRVDVNEAEMAGIARELNQSPEDVLALYTEPDPAGGRRILKQAGGQCVFLDGSNLCIVYESRPKACREFPHLEPEEASLGSRMSSICRKAWFCPIVYNTLEQYKRLVGYHPQR